MTGALLGVRPVAAEAAVVRALRTLPSGGLTRVIIDCSEKVAYRMRRSAGTPTRITVDLRGARLAPEAGASLELGAGPLRTIAAARTEVGVRLVLTARGTAAASAFPLLDPFRLVVDVSGVAEAVAVRPARPGKKAPGRRTSPRRRLRVVIDPGHGGKDPGAVGVRGVREKDVVLAISRRLADKIRRRDGYEVFLTRDSDVYVPLEERTARANEIGADLFVSIHANASLNRSASGVETYYLENTDDRATIRLAKLENGLLGAAGGPPRESDVKWILSDLVQSYKVEESTELAERLQKSAVARLRADYSGVRDLGVKRGPFFVLVGAAMPCVLVEVSFLTHAREGARLASSAYQEAIAEGLLLGLREFVENRRLADSL